MAAQTRSVDTGIVRKAFELSALKSMEEGSGGFSGYASTFGNVDRAGDRIVRGAFAADLDRFIRDGWVAIGHNWMHQGVGYIAKAYEDEKGLYVEVVFHSDPEAQKARQRMLERIAAGKSVSMSIGFFIVDYKWVDGTLEILKVRLEEVSIVNAPANEMAKVITAKSLPFGDALEHTIKECEGMLERIQERVDYRQKEGREMSSANLAMIGDIIEKLKTTVSALQDLYDRNQKSAGPATSSEAGIAEDVRKRWEQADAELRAMEFNYIMESLLQ